MANEGSRRAANKQYPPHSRQRSKRTPASGFPSGEAPGFAPVMRDPGGQRTSRISTLGFAVVRKSVIYCTYPTDEDALRAPSSVPHTRDSFPRGEALSYLLIHKRSRKVHPSAHKTIVVILRRSRRISLILVIEETPLKHKTEVVVSKKYSGDSFACALLRKPRLRMTGFLFCAKS